MKNYKYILMVLILCGFSSCKKDFLEVKNTENLFRESYVNNLTSMQEYVNGTYVMLGSKFEAGMISSYAELAADNIRPLSLTSPTNMFVHYNWVQKADGINGMDELWGKGYTIIRACNFVVEDVDKYRSENQEKANNIKGQALALRAYVFFRLVNTFAHSYSYTSNGNHPGIPYITVSDITKPYSRQTVGEVYAGMVDDLVNAIKLLPASVTDIRLMNRNAAKALLARLYLFMGDYNNAKNLALEIADQIPLMTVTAGYPDDIFKFRSPSQTETLFQLTPYYGQAYYNLYLSYYYRSAAKTFLATNDVVDVLKENTNDVRQAWVANMSGQWVVVKFPAGVAPEVTPAITYPEIAYYPSVIRSSEMFLTVAEASFKMGDENTARTYLDAVRKRASPSASMTDATGTALQNIIYRERRKELAFEGLRIYDLQRWKSGVHRTDVLPGSPTDLPFPNDKAIAPIPSSDVNLAHLSQNNGY